MFDDLAAFIKWFMTSAGPIAMVPFDKPFHMIDGVVAITLYRKAPYQVQMFICPPNQIIPEHTHPNVDSFEVYVGGDVRFSLDGKWQSTADERKPNGEGMAGIRAQTIRVKPESVHGGVMGPQGGVFVSVQKWINGVDPSCVAADYVGAVMGPEHFASVTTGTPIIVKNLTAAHAASKE